jgi:cytochrome P450
MARLTADPAELASVDLTGPEISADPFEYFARLRVEAPVFWNTRHRAWLVARYSDVVNAMRDDAFGSDRVGPYFDRVKVADRQRLDRLVGILSRWLVFLSPPDHTRLRGLVHKSFTPRRVNALKGRAEEIAEDLAADVARRLKAGETVDLMAAYCMPLPAQMIAGIFGVPVEDGVKLKAWAEELGLFINGALGDPDRDERVAAAMAEFEAYLLALIEHYRKEPADNILSGLVEANDRDGTLSELELLATCTLILDAGYKTIQNAMNNSLLVLMDNPDSWDRLKREPELTGSAVEECLRYYGPGNVIVRRAVRDVTLGDHAISIGDRVYLLPAAANRDSEAFENAEEFMIDRVHNPHLTFGQGIHFCLGASLARMELSVGLAAFLRLVDRPVLAESPSELPWHSLLILHGTEALPVRAAE